MNRKFKRTVFICNRNLCNIINVFKVTYDQLNASFLNKSINFTEPKRFNVNVCKMSGGSCQAPATAMNRNIYK